MTSEAWAGPDPGPDSRPEQWRGDVAAGVEAWTRGARSPREDLAPPPPEDRAHDPEADPESVARRILLDALTGAARSRHDLAARLAKRHVPDDVATRVLDRFEEVGLVDDEAFARTWVDQRGPGRALARRALGAELRRKGIDAEVVRGVLDDVDPDEEREAAARLVRRKLPALLNRVDDATATRRLVGMLARKGHPAGVAYAVVREELAAAGSEAPELDL